MVPNSSFTSRMKRHMSCFSSTFMPAIGSSSSSSSGSGGQRAAELDALLQAVGQPADRHLADVLDLEEVDDPLDDRAVLDLLARAPGPSRSACQNRPVLI